MPTNAQKARAGGHLVVAQLLRRGVGSVAFDDRRRAPEIVASNTDGSRTVTLRVKTKTTGDWQTTVKLGEPREPNENETRFWALVDIGKDPDEPPGYFVVPDWWMLNYIHDEYKNHLQRHGGSRPISPESTHCAIRPADVEGWSGGWEALGLWNQKEVLESRPPNIKRSIPRQNSHETA